MIVARGGNDAIRSGRGNDVICAGAQETIAQTAVPVTMCCSARVGTTSCAVARVMTGDPMAAEVTTSSTASRAVGMIERCP